MLLLSRYSMAPACLAAFLSLAGPADAQGRQDPVRAIWAYSGMWKIETDHFVTAYNKAAAHESSILRNECWKSGQYVACRQIVNGDPKVLLVFTCADERNCTSYQIPPDGSEPSSGKLLIDGNTWTFPWSTTEDGKTTWFRVVNVWPSHDAIEYRQEFSTDQQHWTVMASGHETRLPPGRMPNDLPPGRTPGSTARPSAPDR